MRKRVSRSIDIERALAQALARREALLDEDERALPSEDLLALFAGTATSAERSRLIGAPAGRAAVRAILAQAEGGERRQRGAARLAAWAPRVAAAVLLGLVLWQAGRSTDDGTVCRTVAALEARDFDLADALWTRPDEERGTWSPRSSMLRAPAAPTPRLQVAAPLCRSLLARPVLRWQAPRAAGPFHVSLEDAGGRTLLAAVVSGTSLAWPADACALERGQAYRVVVADLSGRQRSAKTVFTVVAEADAAALEGLLDEIDARVASAAARSFLRARALTRHAVLGAAGEELLALAAALGEDAAAPLESFLRRNAAEELADLIAREQEQAASPQAPRASLSARPR